MSTRVSRGRSFLPVGLALCLVFLSAFPPAILAAPLFTDPEVTAYVAALTQFRDRYLAAVALAAKHGDEREIKRMDAELPEWQDRAVRLLDKLQPNETKRFTEYVTHCGQTMRDATYGFARFDLK